METVSWMQSVVQSFKSQTATWIVAFLVAVLSVFSSKITENIKFAINKADLRSKYYEELVSDISEFGFEAELWIELVKRGWTTEDSLKQNVKEYNDSITKLRKKEWVYRSWIKRYWEKTQVAAFAQYMDKVKAFDIEIHGLNDEIEAVITKKRNKFEQVTAEEAVKRLEPALKEVQDSSTNLIQELQ